MDGTIGMNDEKKKLLGSMNGIDVFFIEETTDLRMTEAGTVEFKFPRKSRTETASDFFAAQQIVRKHYAKMTGKNKIYKLVFRCFDAQGNEVGL